MQDIASEHPAEAPVPAILATIGVADGVQDPVEAPESTECGCRSRIGQACNEHGADGSSLILKEVLVATLGAVELVHGFGIGGRSGLDLLVRGVGVRVGDLGRLAETRDADAEPGVDEEGASYGEERVAGGSQHRRRNRMSSDDYAPILGGDLDGDHVV